MQVVANRIIGKSSEQIRAELNLADDFTEEERAQIKKENEWGREWRRMTLPFHFTLPFVQIYTLYNQNDISGFLLNHFHSSGKLCFPELMDRVSVNKFWVFFSFSLVLCLYCLPERGLRAGGNAIRGCEDLLFTGLWFPSHCPNLPRPSVQIYNRPRSIIHLTTFHSRCCSRNYSRNHSRNVTP